MNREFEITMWVVNENGHRRKTTDRDTATNFSIKTGYRTTMNSTSYGTAVSNQQSLKLAYSMGKRDNQWDMRRVMGLNANPF